MRRAVAVSSTFHRDSTTARAPLARNAWANPSSPSPLVNWPTPVSQALSVTRSASMLHPCLTVEAVRQGWSIDADLVTLSACDTGVGQFTNGDGLLGFAHAFLARGARAVVLSRWKVDDTATALLMVRFYENLLGRKKMGRAAALEEAQRWLRTLPRK